MIRDPEGVLPPDVAARIRAERRRRRVRRVVRPLAWAAGTIAAHVWLTWNALPACLWLALAALGFVAVGALDYTPGHLSWWSLVGFALALYALRMWYRDPEA